jgi:hypothetical protein
MAVAVRQNGPEGFDFSKPVPLFTVATTPVDATAGGALDRGWDVTADGERFLFIVDDRAESDLQTATLELTLIHNWTEELKRLVPRDHE